MNLVEWKKGKGKKEKRRIQDDEEEKYDNFVRLVLAQSVDSTYIVNHTVIHGVSTKYGDQKALHKGVGRREKRQKARRRSINAISMRTLAFFYMEKRRSDSGAG